MFGPYTVRAGSSNYLTGGTVHTPTRTIVHEKYSWRTYDYNVALVEVCISFNASIYNKISITYCCDNQL
jgi:hypothetical protein